MKWGRAASVFAQSAVKRSLIAEASPARRKDVLAVAQRCFEKALTTINCSRIKKQRNSFLIIGYSDISMGCET
jgi:hypothetical protein